MAYYWLSKGQDKVKYDMYYQEYVRSAYRHLSTCKLLMSEVEKVHGNQSDRKHWICEVYYLSGYILECMLSYVLFYKYKDHVSNHQYYKDKFLTHNLMSKVHYVVVVAGCQLRGVTLISTPHEKRAINSLFSKWSVNYRYEPLECLNKDEITIYLQSIEEAMKQILNNYPQL